MSLEQTSCPKAEIESSCDDFWGLFHLDEKAENRILSISISGLAFNYCALASQAPAAVDLPKVWGTGMIRKWVKSQVLWCATRQLRIRIRTPLCGPHHNISACRVYAATIFQLAKVYVAIILQPIRLSWYNPIECLTQDPLCQRTVQSMGQNYWKCCIQTPVRACSVTIPEYLIYHRDRWRHQNIIILSSSGKTKVLYSTPESSSDKACWTSSFQSFLSSAEKVAPLDTVLKSQSFFIASFQTLVSLTAQTKSLDFFADMEVLLLLAKFPARRPDTASTTFLVRN